MRASTYRIRSGRFLGLFAVGPIILGAAAVLWGLGADTRPIAALLVLAALATVAGLWIMARPPVLARLDADGIRVRGVRTTWRDIDAIGKVETSHGSALAIRTTDAGTTMLIPVRWLAPSRATALDSELNERLNTAHGYREWDGTLDQGPSPGHGSS